MVRAGLRQFLTEDRSITEIGEAASGNETLDQLRSGNWDLVILDINMPDRSGLDILRYVRASYPNTKVLVLSGFPEQQYAINVLKAGAGGYLPKECAPEELLKATRVVMQGRRYVSANLAELLLSDLDGDSDQPLHRRLSEREFQIERGGQWDKGKNCETFNPLGPWIADAQDIGDPQNLNMKLWVNGQMRQDSNTKNMVFGVAHLVWYLSQFMVLRPGDVINTGTPHGVALGLADHPYLREGDVVELEIEGLGRQRQVFGAA